MTYEPGVSFMLWYSDAKDDLASKVARAVARHDKKYGVKANLCYVHPSVLVGEIITPGVTLLPMTAVMPNYFLVGVSDVQQSDIQGRPELLGPGQG